jgi:hypothetical protein
MKTLLDNITDTYAFEAYLFSKYPDMFPVDDDGNLLPQINRCFNDCPLGWKTIVESLFACIHTYTTQTSRMQKNEKRKFRYNFRKAYKRYVEAKLLKLIDPYIIDPSTQRRVMATSGFKLWLYNNISKFDRKFLYRNDFFVAVKPEPVTILQYKEKFGTLRVYQAGGDDIVDGMIRYAEYLSSITCQDTGKPGSPHKKGMWYATLSKAVAKKQGYEKVEKPI